jgi:hypothetical protein
MPTLLGFAGQSNVTAPPEIAGMGHDLVVSLQKPGDDSPRKDVVLVLDDTTNFVAYTKPPFKMLVGFMGSGEWAQEPPASAYLMGPNATLLHKLEEHLQDLIDQLFDTRDISFFWHEVLHILMENWVRKKGEFNFADAGKLVLNRDNVAAPLSDGTPVLFSLSLS